MEVRLVLVADRADDLVHAQLRRAQQPLRNAQALLLQERLKVLAEGLADPAREIGGRIADRLRKFGQGCFRITLPDVGGDGSAQHLFGRGDAQPVDERLFIAGKVGKEQGEQLRQYAVPARNAAHERIDEVVQQVADGENLLRAEEQVFSFAVRVEVPREKFAHDGIVFHVVKDILQKGVGDDEIDAEVLPLRPQDAVADMPVQKEDVPALQNELFRADDVRDAAFADVHEFHIVVPVFGEVDEPRVQPQIDLPVSAEQLFAVHDKAVR